MPGFLAVLPRDFMDGDTLRYRLHTDGSFTLYYVGHDGKDQGGDPRPESTDDNREIDYPWSGRDWVWPRVAIEARTSGDQAAMVPRR